jgi:tetratricopeptide (TPR) repeat protein
VQDGVAEVMMEAARVLTRGGYPIEALAYVQLALYISPSHQEAVMLLAQQWEQLENHEMAIAAYQKVEEKSGFYKQAQIAIAKNYFYLGEIRKSKTSLQSMLKGDETDMLVLLILADLLRQNKEYEVSAKYYEESLGYFKTEQRNQWSVYFAAGIANERAKEWDKAEKYLLKASEMQPESPEVLNYLGYSWINRGKNIEEGKQLIEKALRYAPENPHILDSMGWAHYLLGDYPKAQIFLEKAIEYLPYDPVLNDHLGDIYWKQGRFREAKFQWQRALENLEDVSDISDDDLQEKLENGLSS